MPRLRVNLQKRHVSTENDASAACSNNFSLFNEPICLLLHQSLAQYYSERLHLRDLEQ